MKIKELLEYLKESGESFEFNGDENCDVDGFSSLKNYKEGTFTWIKKIESIPKGMDIGRCKLVVTQTGENIGGSNIIYTDSSKRVFFSLVEYFAETSNEVDQLKSIGHNTYISDECVIGEGVKIGHNCSLDGNIKVGINSIIGNNVSIKGNVKIGENAIIESGVCIGDADLGYVEVADGHRKMLSHYGGVEIGKSVYIGTGTTVSRGTIDDTVIGDETSIDALCQVSHNCILGKKNTLVSGTYLYGSVETGDNVYIASSVIMNQIKLGDNVTVGMNSVVMSDVESGLTVFGTPAKAHQKSK